MSETKSNFGRPTKWREEFCELLVAHMAQGYSFASFGGTAKCTEETLHQWKKKYPNFSESYKLGASLSMQYWEKLGMAQATGQTKGSSATWIFNMKNRFGWKDKIEQTTTVDNNIIISIDDDDVDL